jgi:hypothetical protein
LREGLIEFSWRQALPPRQRLQSLKSTIYPLFSIATFSGWLTHGKYALSGRCWGDSAFKRGRVAAHKIGRLWKFNKKEVDEWVRSDKTDDNEPGSKGDR